jgi:chemotaxis signal transduction protein
MVLRSDPTKIPDVPDYFRGIIHLRGNVIFVIDLRKRLGQKGKQEEQQELIEMLRQRSGGHDCRFADSA